MRFSQLPTLHSPLSTLHSPLSTLHFRRSPLSTLSTLRVLPLIAASALTLPILETQLGKAFSYSYLVVMLFWLARSILVALNRYKEIKENLSAMSIKNAMDSLQTGVMFCEEDGFIVLSNTRMQYIMKALTGKVSRNGRQFYGLLTLGEIEPGCTISWFEGQNVCMLPDGTAWRFSITELWAGRKKYYQLTAADVTISWQLTARLAPKNDELLQRQNELSKTIKNLHILTREIETQKAKMRAHDILGERLTLLLRSVRGEKALDYGLLRTLSLGLIEELKTIHSAPAPQDELDSLRQTFGYVGVELLVVGQLPEDSDLGQLIVDITREAVTNAVRHGFATCIQVKIDDAVETCVLQVTDNGHPPPSEITEGGGISGIRKKVAQFGGTVTVFAQPRFTLNVEIPVLS